MTVAVILEKWESVGWSVPGAFIFNFAFLEVGGSVFVESCGISSRQCALCKEINSSKSLSLLV